MESLAYAVTLTTMHCGKCGGTYAINESYRAQCYQDSKFWHCPYCQTSWGYRDGENAKLKREIAQEKERKERALSEANQLRASLNAHKGAKTKLKNRIANGVCPCCTRSFSDLHRHMKSKHPDYTAQP